MSPPPPPADDPDLVARELMRAAAEQLRCGALDERGFRRVRRFAFQLRVNASFRARVHAYYELDPGNGETLASLVHERPLYELLREFPGG